MTECSLQPKIQRRGLARHLGVVHHQEMGKKRGPYHQKRAGERPRRRPLIRVRQWRAYRGWTVEELAERSGLSVGAISGMEHGVQGFSEESVVALAKAFGCTAGELLDVDPSETGSFWQIWSQMSPEERQRAARVIEAMRRG